MLQAGKAANNTNKEPSKEPKSKKPKNGNNGRDMPTNDESIRLAKAKKVAKAQKEEAMRVAERKLVAAADRSNLFLRVRSPTEALQQQQWRRRVDQIKALASFRIAASRIFNIAPATDFILSLWRRR